MATTRMMAYLRQQGQHPQQQEPLGLQLKKNWVALNMVRVRAVSRRRYIKKYIPVDTKVLKGIL